MTTAALIDITTSQSQAEDTSYETKDWTVARIRCGYGTGRDDRYLDFSIFRFFYGYSIHFSHGDCPVPSTQIAPTVTKELFHDRSFE